MRLLSLPINDDLLEVHNSIWSGVESIYFNGQLASSGFSMFGRHHYFTVDAADGDGIDKFRVEISMTWSGIVVDVFRNDRCLLASSKTPISRVDNRLLPEGDTKPFHLRRAEREEPRALDDEFFV